jgi:rubredoxin
MPQIASHEEVKANCKYRKLPDGHHWRTDFLVTSAENEDAPVAFLAEGTPNRVTHPHFHEVDQFQVIVKGDGVLGKHPLAMHDVHFTRAHTPYGPIVAGQQGLGFLTLRARWDPGAQYMPQSRARLKELPQRRAWQVQESPNFDAAGRSSEGVYVFSKITDDSGLSAFSMRLQPNASTVAPDPRSSAGQYIIVTKGSLIHQDRVYPALSIAFLRPTEPALQLIAGAEGLEALVLNYPRSEGVKAKPATAKSSQYRTWQCALCAFTYDEGKGMPEEGIAAGTRWEDVPETWSCPDCAASKSDFEMHIVSG